MEWLGDVPEHWDVLRFKDAADVQTGLTLGENNRGVASETYPYHCVANVQVGRLDLRHVKQIDVPPSEARGALLRHGDVLMTEGGDSDKLGRGRVWHDAIPECIHQNHSFAVRCHQPLLAPECLAGPMASQHGRIYFQLTAKQTTKLASTNSTTLRAFPVLAPFFVGIDIRKLSVSPVRIEGVKRRLASFPQEEMRRISRELLAIRRLADMERHLEGFDRRHPGRPAAAAEAAPVVEGTPLVEASSARSR